MKTSDDQSRLTKARLQMMGACLLDSSLAWHIPATVHLSEYGAFLIVMIQRGMGLDSIVRHLEAVGLVDVHKVLSEAAGAISDGSDIAEVFWLAVRVLVGGRDA